MYQSIGNHLKPLENTFPRRAYTRPDLENFTHDVLTFWRFWRFFASLTQRNSSYKNFSPAIIWSFIKGGAAYHVAKYGRNIYVNKVKRRAETLPEIVLFQRGHVRGHLAGEP